MYNCNVDDAVKSIKTIVENNRCVFCDKLNAPFVRYPCGHLACSNCAETAADCLLCLTPPDASAYFVDEPSSQRVRNASELLIAFQELYQFDVYKRQRVSEKLKLEKQLFPECIQASTKYCNKRKSLSTTPKESKRFSSLPGEKISINKLSIMENTVNYVENWLNKNESLQMNLNKNLPRKPFTDLNVNQTNIKDANNLGFQTSNKKSLGRKRTHLKIIKTTSNKPKVSSKRVKTNTFIKEYEIQSNKKSRKCENNESGIFIDDDTINIEDSQSEIIDKDQLALLEVLEADKNDNSVDCDIKSSMKTRDNLDVPNKSQDALKTYKVPFFKKSNFVNLKNENIKDITKNVPTSQNITVTIDNESFVTTIKLSNLAPAAASSSKSTAAQTDDNILDAAIPMSIPDEVELNLTKEHTNVVHEDRELIPEKSDSDIGNKRKCLIIEASDSDSDLTDENINSLEVTAEVHQPDNYVGKGVLCELEQNEFKHRAKHAVRELTPLSSDSSDKENYDPNRIKRQKCEKKNCIKK